MADGKNQGEGDYESARKYDAEQEAFAKSGKVEQAPRRKPPRPSMAPKAAELEKARVETGEGKTKPTD